MGYWCPQFSLNRSKNGRIDIHQTKGSEKKVTPALGSLSSGELKEVLLKLRLARTLFSITKGICYTYVLGKSMLFHLIDYKYKR